MTVHNPGGTQPSACSELAVTGIGTATELSFYARHCLEITDYGLGLTTPVAKQHGPEKRGKKGKTKRW